MSAIEIKGTIDRVEDGVAWGAFNDGQTFDIPCMGYTVGDTIIKNVRDDDSAEAFGDVSYILFNDRTATLIYANYEDDGLEIIYSEVFHKETN